MAPSKKQRRKGKAKNKAQAFEAESKDASFTKAKYTKPNPYSATVTNEDGSIDTPEGSEVGADEEGASEPEHSDVEDLEDLRKHQATLKQGEQGAYNRKTKNGNRKNLPPHVAKILQEASWIYRMAWKFGSHESLKREVAKTNEELARQPVDDVYLKLFQKEREEHSIVEEPSDKKTPMQKYRGTFEMNVALLDVITLLKEKVEAWQKMNKGVEKASIAQQLIITMVGQRNSLFYMGLTWKSIVLPSYLESFLEIVNAGLAVSEKEMKDLVQSWIECDGINPTTLQSTIMSDAPRHFDRIFKGLSNGEDIAQTITMLSKLEKEISASNSDMMFKKNDHANLKLHVLRGANAKLQRMEPGESRDTWLKKLKMAYAVELTQAGWGTLIEDIDSLTFSEAEIRNLDRQKQKFIEARKPTDQMVIDNKANNKHDELMKEIESGRTQTGSDSQQDEINMEELEDLLGDDFEDPDGHEIETDDGHRDGNAMDESWDDKDGNIKQEDEEPKLREDWPDDFDDDHLQPQSRPDSPSEGYWTKKIRQRPQTENLFGAEPPSFGTEPHTQKKPQFYNGFRKPVIQGPIKVESRTTPKGYLIGGRLVGGCSSRHIVNIGTFANPVHMVLSGYEFGGRNTGPSLVRKYRLPSPDLPSKAEDRHASDVLNLYHMVEAAPPAAGGRRPVTYYCIQWKTPDSEPLWLSRAELISVTGKAWLDNKNRRLGEPSRHEQVHDAWQHNLKFLAAMKSSGLNPDTMEALSSSDKHKMPWLFKSMGQ